MMTGFTRIVIVLSLLRQALGTQSAPPNQVVVGLSLFLTFLSWGRRLTASTRRLCALHHQRAISGQALDKAEAPMRQFMLKQTRESDFSLFAPWPVRRFGDR